MAYSETAALQLKAGQLCLDFANTAEWHASDHPEESLTSYAALLAWAQGIGLLSERAAVHLSRAAARDSKAAAAVLAAAIALREAIYRIFASHAHGRAPHAGDLTTLNTALARALPHARLVTTADGYAWDWAPDDHPLDAMLWPIARSAADLLTSADLDRVGQCADDRGCGWLFWDTSKNHTRRWCYMRDCGNRAKARRHYARLRERDAGQEAEA